MNNSIDVVGSGVKYLSRNHLIAMAAQVMGAEHKVLLICDLAGGKCEDEIRGYVDALEIADVLDSEEFEKVNMEELQVVVVPFKSLPVAEEIYRSIPHASRFVTIWLNGQPYAGAC